MRIGQDDNFFSIESIPRQGGYASCRVEAVASASGRRFTASHDRLMLDSSDTTIQRFTEFESLRSEQIEIPFTEAGWLRLQRDARGCITVRYRIGGWTASAAMEGELVVEGEFAGSFCSEFGALLRGQR
ncbi:MAG: hypothetical protein H0X66_15985 [Verrucomicrobia bacterium]|nr:hypothetical protein [Verrucomicrobiota bacterium]